MISGCAAAVMPHAQTLLRVLKKWLCRCRQASLADTDAHSAEMGVLRLSDLTREQPALRPSQWLAMGITVMTVLAWALWKPLQLEVCMFLPFHAVTAFPSVIFWQRQWPLHGSCVFKRRKACGLDWSVSQFLHMPARSRRLRLEYSCFDYISTWCDC